MVSEGYRLTIICFVQNCLTFTLYVASTAFPNWGIATVRYGYQVPRILGLWRRCLLKWNETRCFSTADWCSNVGSLNNTICAKMKATQAFMIIACITSGLTILTFFACIFMKKDWCRMVFRINLILLLVTFFAGLIGGCLGISYVKSAEFGLDTSAIVEIVALTMNLICFYSTVAISSQL